MDDANMKEMAKALAAKMRAKEDQLYMAVEKKLFDELEPLSDKAREQGPLSEWFLPGVCAHLVMCEILRRQIERSIEAMGEADEE